MKNILLFSLFIFSSSLFAQSEYGKASFYADKFQGNKTANGERFDQKKRTAAHRTLPFDTWVKVTNLNNQKTVVVRINDRGPFVKGVVIDLSKWGAQQLDMIQAGVVNVKLEIVDGPPSSGKASPSPTISISNNSNSTVEPVIKPKEPINTISLGNTKPKAGKSTNLFSVSVNEMALENYGIQVGSYAQYQNILKRINGLQRNVKQECLVFVGKSSDGGALYKLIVGPYLSKSEAESKLATFKNKGINGFVVDLSKI